jgi:hypothetical protein
MTKSKITKKLMAYQLAAFGLLLFLIVGDEAFDFPHTVFGAPATPINWRESCIEGGYILALCVFSVYLTWRLVTQVKYLEGFLPICMHCKKIRVNDEWQPLEQYLGEHSAAELSHGLCPECLQTHYGEYAKKK